MKMECPRWVVVDLTGMVEIRAVPLHGVPCDIARWPLVAAFEATAESVRGSVVDAVEAHNAYVDEMEAASARTAGWRSNDQHDIILC